MACEFVLDLLNCSRPPNTQVSLSETLQMFQFKALPATAVGGCGAELPSEMCSHSTVATAPEMAQRGWQLGLVLFALPKPGHCGYQSSKPHSHRGSRGSCSPDTTLPPGVASFAIVGQRHLAKPSPGHHPHSNKSQCSRVGRRQERCSGEDPDWKWEAPALEREQCQPR